MVQGELGMAMSTMGMNDVGRQKQAPRFQGLDHALVGTVLLGRSSAGPFQDLPSYLPLPAFRFASSPLHPHFLALLSSFLRFVFATAHSALVGHLLLLPEFPCL